MIDEVLTLARIMVLGMFTILILMSFVVYFKSEKGSEQKSVAAVWLIIILLNLWLVIMAAKTGSII